jgi:hypothetical protein
MQPPEEFDFPESKRRQRRAMLRSNRNDASSPLALPILGDTPAADGQTHQIEPNRCNLVRTGYVIMPRGIIGRDPKREP